jgi:small ligand-binding sensory domain FIST
LINLDRENQMKNMKPYIALALSLPLLSGCVIGTVIGTTAEVAGTAVSVTAKATKAGANVATKAVGKATNTVLGDDEDIELRGSDQE